MKVFLIDAYDSFVFIISQYLEQIGLETRVERHDQPDLIERIEAFAPDFCVLGPGPGHPGDVGYIELIRHFQHRLPLLGVCLGHQAVGLAFGAQVCRAPHVMHGKVSQIENDGKGVYAHTEGRSFNATRYHSLMLTDAGFPDCLEVTSRSADDGYIMGVRHRTLPIEGVQYHPESILTENGLDLFRSFIRHYVD
ncbi:aminodeoxychorismate/anthranilate synthase component II [Pseudomonas sp. efr-133-TYG-103a]|uniref:anthranilate synthase component II n=1 Tax=Pseudomonas sp. efr-133-TYG-103a TaxID=3040308 RepID=UPI0025563662